MHLEAVSLSILGVVLGMVAHFATGAVWYTFLFSKQWMAALGKSMDDPPGMPLPMSLGINAAGSLVTTAVVALLYTWGGGDGPLDGLVCGLIVGAGVVAIEELNRPTYEGTPWSLYLINSGYAVIGYGLAGLVYGLVA
jgi:hypothetical protein